MAADDKPNTAVLVDYTSGSGVDSNSDDESSSEQDNSPVEWLATTRTRRSTAGNRLKSLLAKEEVGPTPANGGDDDLELLFAEDSEDGGFIDDEKHDGFDAHMDSSDDDDEDKEDGAGDDELSGEKELERQTRDKQTARRKRKAQDAIPLKFRKKKVCIVSRSETPTTPAATDPAQQPRPRKKSERLRWLPTFTEAPTRSSSRQTTILSKEQLHERMKIDDIRRRKLAEQQERKMKRLEALRKPPMTQEERLAEAARVEKRNSRSLNRWEEAEKQREEERLRKIAALHSRKLDGPVVTYWSGGVELGEGQQNHIGKMVSMEEKAPRKKRGSMAHVANPPVDATPPMQSTTAAGPATVASIVGVNSMSPTGNADFALFQPPAISAEPSSPGISQSQRAASPAPPLAPTLAVAEAPHQKLSPMSSGVLAAPVLSPPISGPHDGQVPQLGLSIPSTVSNVLAHTNNGQVQSSSSYPPMEVQGHPCPMPRPLLTTPPVVAPEAPMNTSPQTRVFPQSPQRLQAGPKPKTHAQPPPEPPREGKVTQSCIILQNFDEVAIRDKQVQTRILFGRKMTKLGKPTPAPVCPITHHSARYRDPVTGLPYANGHAYREIRRLQRGEFRWSRLVGAWVGSGSEQAASGVPEGFTDPEKLARMDAIKVEDVASGRPKKFSEGGIAEEPVNTAQDREMGGEAVPTLAG